MFKNFFNYFKRDRGRITKERLDDLERFYLECDTDLEYVHPTHCLDLVDEIRRLRGWGYGLSRHEDYYKPIEPTEFDFNIIDGEEIH